MLRWVLVSLAAATGLFAQTSSLNLSRDLVNLKIAGQNMAPDTPALDSRPLLEAAVSYAQSHSISTITADPGAYYVLTGRTTSRFLNFNGLHDLTFDFAGSDLYFALGNWIGIECDACQNVQFLNFTLDSLQLPFTQVRVTSVDTTANRIGYSPLAGFEAATDFNTVRNPLGQDEPLYAFVFRNGSPLRSTGRIAIQRPIDPAFLPAVADGSTWADPKQLSAIQPGDVVALSARAGGPTFAIRDGSGITVRNVAIYYSGQVGLQISATPNATVERVQVIPRPGTARLMSTNADGISAVQLGTNLTIRGCRVKRTGDDGMSPNSQSLALVTSQPAARQVALVRSGVSSFPNNLQIQFIDNKTGMPAVTARIVDQSPPFSTATPAANSAVTLTFDADIPTLAANDPMVYADPAARGSGLLMEGNVVEDTLMARGMSIWGVLGGTIQSNLIRNTAWSGMNLLESLSTKTWLTGPIANLTVRRNVIEQYTTAFGSAVNNAFAGITIGANDLNLTTIAAASPFQNIAIVDNFISGGPYSGIRMQDVSGGSISGNLLMNVASNPTANSPNAAVVASLGQPITQVTNSGVTTAQNTVDTATATAYVASAVSFANDAIAPNSWAAINGTNLAPQTDIASTATLPTALDGVSIAIQDATGATTPALMWFISSGQINFLVPAGIPAGAAVLTVSANGKVTGRGGIMIDTLAPALFSNDGSGGGAALGAAVLTRADGSQSVTPLTAPVQFGNSGDTTTLVLYATGIRALSSQAAVSVRIGTERLPVQFAGAQGAFLGLDQINVNLPNSLKGAGAVPLRVVVDGLTTNVVNVSL
jgi:uncharacterized protein (TIGR03437 family)